MGKLRSIRAVLVACVGALVAVGVGSCSLGDDAMSADSQSEPQSWHVRMTPDTMSITVPDGYRVLDKEAGETEEEFQMVPVDAEDSLAGIGTVYFSPTVIFHIIELANADFDTEAWTRQAMKDDVARGRVTDARYLGGRMIGGSQAYGYSGFF